jgi:hypothetical protein
MVQVFHTFHLIQSLQPNSVVPIIPPFLNRDTKFGRRLSDLPKFTQPVKYCGGGA